MKSCLGSFDEFRFPAGYLSLLMAMNHLNASSLLQRPQEQAYAAYQLAPNTPHCGE